MNVKTAVITGASSGIGRACVDAFANAGYRVVAAGRDPDRTAEAAAAHESVVPWTGDLAETGGAEELVAQARESLAGIGTVVNAAGVIFRADAEHTTDAQWTQTMAVNVDAVFRMCRAVIPVMREAGGGRIVNIASDWGLRGGADAFAYCASKGAVVQMTRAMALDHVADGLRVNAVCPGDVDTPMIYDEVRQQGLDLETAKARIDADNPTGRMTRAGEVASLVLYLASDAATQINGAMFSIDGGTTAG